jgi:methylated-DNA-protein-cysteine methyltransferase-like protein
MHDSFFEQVYRIASMIPRGQVATYGQIAIYLGNPQGARTVGWALSSLPTGMEVPWHRVVNSRGRISGPPSGYRVHEQRALLEEEGIIFDDSGCIDLSRYGWTMPQ